MSLAYVIIWCHILPLAFSSLATEAGAACESEKSSCQVDIEHVEGIGDDEFGLQLMQRKSTGKLHKGPVLTVGTQTAPPTTAAPTPPPTAPQTAAPTPPPTAPPTPEPTVAPAAVAPTVPPTAIPTQFCIFIRAGNGTTCKTNLTVACCAEFKKGVQDSDPCKNTFDEAAATECFASGSCCAAPTPAPVSSETADEGGETTTAAPDPVMLVTTTEAPKVSKMVLSPEQLAQGAAPTNCSKYGGPIQVMKFNKGIGYSVRQLDIESGKYTLLFDIPFELVQGFYSELNACGISPRDSKIYCVMNSALQNYIVRLSPGVVEYVAKLKRFNVYNTGGFDPAGTFYVSNVTADFVVIDKLDEIKGTLMKSDPKILDLSQAPSFRPAGWFAISDVVTFKKDLLGVGTPEQFLISLSGPRLLIAKWSGAGFSHSWVINQTQGNWGDIWGAGWNFNGRVFFAANKGYGVFEVPVLEINVTSMAEVNVIKVGQANSAESNDGMNCLLSPNPWVTKVLPFDCTNHGVPLQMTQSAGGSSIKKLNLQTGFLTDLYDIPFTRTTPNFRFMNAVGMSPIDHIPYGAMLFEKAPGPLYIVRFDSLKIEYVAKMTGKYNPISGCFDKEGNYYFLDFPNLGNGTLYKVPKLDSMIGYSNPANASIPTLDALPGLALAHGEMYQMADIVAITYDVENDGNLTDFILGINRDQQVIVVKWNDANVTASNVWTFKTNNVLGAYGAKLNFGAAWNFNGRVLFASNDGVGVFEAQAYNVTTGVVTMKEIGKSSSVEITDGFNCPSASIFWGNESETVKPLVNFW